MLQKGFCSASRVADISVCVWSFTCSVIQASNEGRKDGTMEPQQRKAAKPQSSDSQSMRQGGSLLQCYCEVSNASILRLVHVFEASLCSMCISLLFPLEPSPAVCVCEKLCLVTFLLFSSCCFLLKLDGNTVRVIVILVC